ncbi:MAG: YdcF family protein [Spirochaetia bacterium]|nr:YdcF family protein [Spirochaetia bacterium]
MLKKIFVYSYKFFILLFIIMTIWNVTLYFKYKNRIYTEISTLPPMQTALVLGTSVKPGGKPSVFLLERLDKAVELYRNHRVQKLLLTGDNTGKYYDEVNAMREYVLKYNVNSKDIFLDHNGIRTLDSIFRGKNKFLIKDAVLVTQKIYQPRALFLAESFDLKAVGYAADSGRVKLSIYNMAREFFARYLAIIDVYLLNKKSKYMGKTISISGNGEKTWDKEIMPE